MHMKMCFKLFGGLFQKHASAEHGVHVAPCTPSILRPERVMGLIDILAMRHHNSKVGHCLFQKEKISENWF